MTIAELKAHFHKGKANAYAWPGGYPMFYLCSDGGVLCPACVTKERARILRSTYELSKHSARSGHDEWAIEGVDVNYEDPDLYCDNCDSKIESAYAES